MRKILSNPFLILLLLGSVFFYKIIVYFNQMIYPSGDIFAIVAPYKIIIYETVKNFHTLPLWNPYVFSGMSFVGNPAPALFYPFTYLIFLFPLYLTFGYLYIFDSFLIGSFTYLFARTIKLNRFGSLVSAIVIMFSPVLIGLIPLGFPANLDTFIWFPLILLLTEKMITDEKIIYSVFAAFPIALSFLAGAPEVSFYMLVAVCIYFLTRLMLLKKDYCLRKRLKKFLFLLVSVLLATGLSAIQLLPTSELAAFSARTQGIFTDTMYLPQKTLISFILPHFFGSSADNTFWAPGNPFVNSIYIGIVPLFLAFLSLFTYKNKYTLVFSFIALFALFYSFGNESFVFPLSQHYFPFAKYFKFSSRFLYIFIFSLSILAGIGGDFFTRQLKIKKRLVNILILSFLGLGMLSLILFFYINNPSALIFFDRFVLGNNYAQNQNHFLIFLHILSDLRFLAFIFLFFSAILIIFKIVQSNQFLKISLILLIFFDLFLINSTSIKTVEIQKAINRPKQLKELKDDDLARTFRLDKLSISQENAAKIQSVKDFDPLFLSYYRDFLYLAGPTEERFKSMFSGLTDITNQNIINLLNVKYIHSKKPLTIPGLKLISKATLKNGEWKGTYYIYENRKLLPRAYIVPDALVIADNKKALSILANNKIDIKKTIILDKNPKTPLKNPVGKSLIKVNYYEPNKISLSASLSNSGYLVLSEIWYPGWKVFVNGRQKEILKADTIFRAAYLGSGKSNIVFIYNPDSFEKGKAISVVTLIVCLGWYASYLFLRRKTSLN